MITIETLNHWLVNAKESEHLEFKEAKQQFDTKKLMQYCVALANERGGHLVLGVGEGSPRYVVGTKAFLNVVEIKTKILEQLHFRVDITEINHADGRVLVFQIPSRPIGQPLQYEGAYWMRTGESLVSMTPDQLQRIFAEGQLIFLNQYASVHLSSDEVIALLDAQSFFDLFKIPFPSTREGVLQRLLSEKLILTDNSHYLISNLGAILLAKDLRNFESLKHKIIRTIKYRGTNKLETEREHISYKGYAVGFEELIEYINSQLPMNEIVGKALRKEVFMYPQVVVREIVANALIHQDFDQTGLTVMIEIYADRIEISNPGKPLIEVERFVDEYKSRNEQLADIMRRIGICEEKGSGIDQVVFNTELYQLPAPDVRISTLRTTIVLFAYKDFKLMDATDRLRACYLHCCLKYVSNERMTNQSLRERFKLEDTRSKSTIVSQIIASSLDQSKIKPDDPENASKRYAKYIPFWA